MPFIVTQPCEGCISTACVDVCPATCFHRGNGILLIDPTMTKKDIVRRIADDLGRTTIETAPIVQKTLDAIINILAEEGRVELRNFGVFTVKKRKGRQGRNPRTGEKVMVGERVVVTFKPGQVLKERVATERGRQVDALEEASSLEERS